MIFVNVDGSKITVASDDPMDSAFVEWVGRFNSGRGARLFYEAIRKLPDSETDRWLFAYACLASGYHASIWQDQEELGRRLKESRDAFNDSIADQLRAINTLCAGLSRNGLERLAAAFAIVKLKHNQLVFNNLSHDKVQLSDMLLQLLRNYHSELDQRRKDMLDEPSTVRELTYMCIRWPDGRDIPENSADLGTALSFDILCLLDKYAHGQGLIRINPTPLNNPKYAQATKIAIMLCGAGNSDTLRKFVTRNPGIQQHPWPTMYRTTV